MKLNPYLSFDGRCREAFEFYEKALGGRIIFMQTIGESPMASSIHIDQFDTPWIVNAGQATGTEDE